VAGRLRKGMVWLGLVEPDEQDLHEVEPGVGRPAPAAAPADLRRVREDREIERHRDRYDEPVGAVVRPIPSPSPGKVHLIEPAGFNDAEEIGERFKAGIPVIMNLQGLDNDVSRRMIDFAAGLTFGLDGGIQPVANKVFLLTPHNVEVSAEERRRLQERGFFNQS
jgi:cell division inhibitor SepF